MKSVGEKQDCETSGQEFKFGHVEMLSRDLDILIRKEKGWGDDKI